MIDQWIKEIKGHADFKDIGMFLVHNGVVRATSREGNPVKGMQLSYDKKNSVLEFGGSHLPTDKVNIYEKQIKQDEYFTRWMQTVDGIQERVYRIQSVRDIG